MSRERSVRFAIGVLDAIRDEARRAYPYEGCGALLGPSAEHITDTEPLPNAEGTAPRVKFAVSPRDYLAVEDRAEARGLRLLGFWHSHPDHPARPSETDRRFAWEGLLTVVVGVQRGTPEAITAWDLSGPDQSFEQARIDDLSAERTSGEATAQEVP
jgi:proteasome lid subunit RPN8/RPN11